MICYIGIGKKLPGYNNDTLTVCHLARARATTTTITMTRVGKITALGGFMCCLSLSWSTIVTTPPTETGNNSNDPQVTALKEVRERKRENPWIWFDFTRIVWLRNTKRMQLTPSPIAGIFSYCFDNGNIGRQSNWAAAVANNREKLKLHNSFIWLCVAPLKMVKPIWNWVSSSASGCRSIDRRVLCKSLW